MFPCQSGGWAGFLQTSLTSWKSWQEGFLNKKAFTDTPILNPVLEELLPVLTYYLRVILISFPSTLKWRTCDGTDTDGYKSNDGKRLKRASVLTVSGVSALQLSWRIQNTLHHLEDIDVITLKVLCTTKPVGSVTDAIRDSDVFLLICRAAESRLLALTR